MNEEFYKNMEEMFLAFYELGRAAKEYVEQVEVNLAHWREWMQHRNNNNVERTEEKGNVCGETRIETESGEYVFDDDGIWFERNDGKTYEIVNCKMFATDGRKK